MKQKTNTPSKKSAILAVASVNLLGLDIGVLAGSIARRSLYGGSLQGELGEILGFRFEGHLSPENRKISYGTPKSLVASKKDLAKNTLVSFEGFFNERGFVDASGYETIGGETDSGGGGTGTDTQGETNIVDDPSGEEENNGPQGQLGRAYLGLGVDWQFEPLTALKLLSLGNISDNSSLNTIRVVHSLSQISEISLSVTLPSGPSPKDEVLKSEYGAYPKLIQADFSASW